MVCDRCKTEVKETFAIFICNPEEGAAKKKQLCRGCLSRLRAFLTEPLFEEIIFEEEKNDDEL